MHKCLKITFSADFPDGFLHDVVQKAAQNLRTGRHGPGGECQ